MTLRSFARAVALLIIVVCHGLTGSSAVAAILESTENVGGRFDGQWSIGVSFEVEEPMTINALGYWESEDGLQDEHEVAIWVDDPGEDPLAFAVVPPEDEGVLVDSFRYVEIPELILEPGEVYVIGGHTGNELIDYFNDAADPGPGGEPIDDDPDADPGIGYLGGDGVILLQNRCHHTIGLDELMFPDGDGGGTPGRWAGPNATFLNFGGGIDGDYNDNGVLDAADLDLLAQFANDQDLTGDVNSDGLVNALDRDAWVETLQKSWVGDSNFDGEFNSSDFVTAFVAGKYDTGSPALYAEGDWNGDSVFDSGDFVAAFTAGGFEIGPRQAVAAVPEPSSILLAICSFAGLLRLRRSRCGHRRS